MDIFPHDEEVEVVWLYCPACARWDRFTERDDRVCSSCGAYPLLDDS